MINEGVYPDLKSEDYHADKNSISRSALMDFDRSPYTYWAKHVNHDRPKKNATPQMILGSAFHTMILEPHLFDEYYACLPPKVLLKNVGRETYDSFKKKEAELLASSKIIISDEDFLNLVNMRIKLESHPQAMELIKGARIEHSFFWKDKDSELMVKCRPDVLHHNMIVDLKTCTDAFPRAFQYEMIKYGYHIQGAMVRDGVEYHLSNRINNIINVCIETKYPYNMGIYIIDESAIDAGQLKYKDLLLELKQAKKENVFQDYGIQTICLPPWLS